MTRNEAWYVLRTLDMLGLALAAEYHAWTVLERRSYERSVRLLEKAMRVQKNEKGGDGMGKRKGKPCR